MRSSLPHLTQCLRLIQWLGLTASPPHPVEFRHHSFRVLHFLFGAWSSSDAKQIVTPYQDYGF